MEKELPWSSHERVMYHPVSHDMSSREREEKSGEARRHIVTPAGLAAASRIALKKKYFAMWLIKSRGASRRLQQWEKCDSSRTVQKQVDAADAHKCKTAMPLQRRT